jgi:RNA polymerase sigma-70 factor, ECF subfamily
MDAEAVNKDILTEAVLLHAMGLKRFALSLCRDDNDADDLVSETVVKAFENFHKMKDESKLKPWLFRILNNSFISAYRSGKKYQAFNSPDRNDKDTDSSFSLFEEITQSSFTEKGDPEKTFISKVTQQRIQEAISELPEDFKITLLLCDVEEFSYAEIAAITSVPVGTVRSRVARARTILQKRLWIYAQELGIKKSKTKVERANYVCTCGKEEVKQLDIITE